METIPPTMTSFHSPSVMRGDRKLKELMMFEIIIGGQELSTFALNHPRSHSQNTGRIWDELGMSKSYQTMRRVDEIRP